MGNTQTDFRENKNSFLSIDMGMVNSYFIENRSTIKKNIHLDIRRKSAVDDFFTILKKIFIKTITDELRTLFYKFEPRKGRREHLKLDENRLFLTLYVILIHWKKQTLVLKHAQKAPEKTDAEVQPHADRNGRFWTVLGGFLLPILAKRLICKGYQDDLA